MSDHPATTRAGHYVTGQPYFSRTLKKQTEAWLRRRQRERDKQAAETPASEQSEEKS